MKLLKLIYLISVSALVSSKSSNDSNLPSFSLPSGFYDGESLKVEINVTDPNAIIYYTLDGSIPTENSPIYEAPFTLKNRSNEENVLSNIIGIVPNSNFTAVRKVNKGNVIRALAKLSDGSFTDVISGTYFVGLNKNELYGDHPIINIITDPANLFDYDNGIYNLGKAYDDWIEEDPEHATYDNYLVQANYSKKGKEGERPAIFEYIPGNSNITAYSQNIGLRLKGTGTRYHYQKSLKLISREEYGSKSIKYELIPGNIRADGNGPVTKYKSFNLRNGGNDSEYSKMRDVVIQELAANPLFETQQSTVSIVFLDGEYWGMYMLTEEYSGQYIANNYDIDNNNVIIIKSDQVGYKVEDGEENDMELFNQFKSFIAETDMSIPGNYEKVKNMLDIEGYIWYSAIYAYINVVDGWFAGGNWAMWRARNADSSVPKADGKWRMMMYDTEYSTAVYSRVNYTLDVFPEVFKTTDTETDVTNSLGSLITRSLCKNEEFKRMFINALCDAKNILYKAKKALKRIDEKIEIIEPLVVEHILRNGPERDVETPIENWMARVIKFKNWIIGRDSSYIKIIEDDFNLKPAVNVTITSNNFKKGGFSLNNGWVKFNESYQGEYFPDNHIQINAKPAKGEKLKSWVLRNCKLAGKGRNTINIYPKKGCTVTLKYY